MKWLKTTTKIVVLFCLVNVTVVPIWKWLLVENVDLTTVAAFVAASGVPLGILIGFLGAKSITTARQTNGG